MVEFFQLIATFVESLLNMEFFLGMSYGTAILLFIFIGFLGFLIKNVVFGGDKGD